MSEKAKIHVTYVIGLLLIVIVLLVTVQWGSIPGLVSYISFALTVTSLLLAALAIGYSIYSNNSLSMVLSRLTASSDDINESSTSIAAAATRLGEQIGDIPQLIEGVGKRVEETHLLLKEYSDRASQVPTDTKTPPAPQRAPEGFVQRSSILGLCALYACYKAYTKKIPFDLGKLSIAAPGLKREYSFGFLVASIAAGVFAGKSSRGIWSVTDFPDHVAKELPAAISSRSEKLDSPAVRELFKNVVQKIDEYFT